MSPELGVDGGLTDADIEKFIRDGYLHYPLAIPEDLVTRCREWLIKELGINIHDPSTWSDEPVMRIGGSREHMFWEVMNQPSLVKAYDALIGPGRWQNPVQGTGSFPIRFPSTLDPGDAGWHIDGSFTVDGDFHVTLDSKERSLLLLILFSDVTELDAPTRIRRGSHLLVPELLRDIEDSVSFTYVYPKISDAVDSLPLDLATGKAGDVYLCHPFLVHAASFPHRGDSPRFISQPGIAPALPFEGAPYDGLITNGRLNLEREAGDHSPVEQAIRAGLQFENLD